MREKHGFVPALRLRLRSQLDAFRAIISRWWTGRTHRHEWEDHFVFDSCIETNLQTGERRVLGQAVMMTCLICGEMQRRPLATWAEAVEANEHLPHFG